MAGFLSKRARKPPLSDDFVAAWLSMDIQLWKHNTPKLYLISSQLGDDDCNTPDYSADAGDVVDGIPKHDKVHGLFALAVKLP